MDRSFEVGEYGEGMPWKIQENYDVESDERYGPWACSHAVFLREEERRDYRGVIYAKVKIYRLPRGILALNEGGCNSTLVCGDCIREALSAINLDKEALKAEDMIGE